MMEKHCAEPLCVRGDWVTPNVETQQVVTHSRGSTVVTPEMVSSFNNGCVGGCFNLFFVSQ